MMWNMMYGVLIGALASGLICDNLVQLQVPEDECRLQPPDQWQCPLSFNHTILLKSAGMTTCLSYASGSGTSLASVQASWSDLMCYPLWESYYTPAIYGVSSTCLEFPLDHIMCRTPLTSLTPEDQHQRAVEYGYPYHKDGLSSWELQDSACVACMSVPFFGAGSFEVRNLVGATCSGKVAIETEGFSDALSGTWHLVSGIPAYSSSWTVDLGNVPPLGDWWGSHTTFVVLPPMQAPPTSDSSPQYLGLGGMQCPSVQEAEASDLAACTWYRPSTVCDAMVEGFPACHGQISNALNWASGPVSPWNSSSVSLSCPNNSSCSFTGFPSLSISVATETVTWVTLEKNVVCPELALGMHSEVGSDAFQFEVFVTTSCAAGIVQLMIDDPSLSVAPSTIAIPKEGMIVNVKVHPVPVRGSFKLIASTKLNSAVLQVQMPDVSLANPTRLTGWLMGSFLLLLLIL